MEEQIGPEHAGDGAAGADRRDVGQRAEAGVGEGRGVAREQVEEQIADVPQPVLDVVAEDPEEEHVAQEVPPAAVQEHGEERALQARGPLARRDGAAVEQPGRDERRGHQEALEPLAQGELVEEDQGVGRDQQRS